MAKTKITLKFTETMFETNGLADYVVNALADNSNEDESGQGYIFAQIGKNGSKGHVSAELFDAAGDLLTSVHVTGQRSVPNDAAGMSLKSKDDQASGELIDAGTYAPAPGQSGVILLGISGNMSVGLPAATGRTGAFPTPPNGLDVS